MPLTAYIGELVGTHKRPNQPMRARVKILAIVHYPWPRKANYTLRPPHDPGHTKTFNLCHISQYDGGIPDYKQTLRDSLNKAIERVKYDIEIMHKSESGNGARRRLQKVLQQFLAEIEGKPYK